MNDNETYPNATVREVNGQLVLDDPEALAMFRAVQKHNCGNTFALNRDRVGHFIGRVRDLGKTPLDVVIVLLNVDDPNGGALADILMPGHNWQVYRDKGEIPFARGLAAREFIQEALTFFDKDAAGKLERSQNLAVVVVDFQVAEVYDAVLSVPPDAVPPAAPSPVDTERFKSLDLGK